MNQILTNAAIMKIFGRVEIATIAKKIEGKKLKQTERNYLYRSIRPKLMAAEMLSHEGILREVNKGRKLNKTLIEYNLACYGYELISLKKKKSRKVSIEELIAMILVRCPCARYIEAIPFLLLKNKTDPFALLEIALEHGIKNKIGFLLETSFIIKEIPYLRELLDYLKEHKEEETSYLVEGDLEFLEKTSPPRVRKWNLLGRFFDEDFKKLAEVYL